VQTRSGGSKAFGIRRPCGGGFLGSRRYHGFRCAPPVATDRDPFGTGLHV